MEFTPEQLKEVLELIKQVPMTDTNNTALVLKYVKLISSHLNGSQNVGK